jgi:hypothetical protein
MIQSDRPPDVIDALVDLADVAAQILGHMALYQAQGHSAPDAPPPVQVFRDLLSQTLRPLADRHPTEAIDAAQRVLAEAVELIESELFLVEPPRVGESNEPVP